MLGHQPCWLMFGSARYEVRGTYFGICHMMLCARRITSGIHWITTRLRQISSCSLSDHQSGSCKPLLGAGNSCLNLCGSYLGFERTHNGGRGSPHRISAGRNRFSSITLICSGIPTAISSSRDRRAVAVCKSQPDPDNGGAAKRNQMGQFIQVSRDSINDYAEGYCVRVRCTDGLQLLG